MFRGWLSRAHSTGGFTEINLPIGMLVSQLDSFTDLPSPNVLSTEFDLFSKFCRSSGIDTLVTTPLVFLFPLFN